MERRSDRRTDPAWRFFRCAAIGLGVWLTPGCTQPAPTNDGGDVGGNIVNDGTNDVNSDGNDSGSNGGSDGGQLPPFLPVGSGPAIIYFTDLTSGPSSGGANGAGAYVTLYGNGFGDVQGASTVTIGGAEAADYPLWTNTKLAIQLGQGTSTGDIAVHTPDGESNAVPFTVRPGRILFVSNDGNDDAAGGFDNPWRTLPHAVESVAAGDIIYAMDGVSATNEHLNEAALSIEAEGTADQPIALLAYPGATVTVGSSQSLQYGLRVAPPVGVHASHWVIGGIRFRGQTSAIELGGDGAVGWRLVGNDISCPEGDGPTGCFAASLATYARFLGNDIHDSGVSGASKQYHAVYFTTDSNHIEVGWNHIHDNRTCRALQFHSSPLCLPDCGPSDTTGFNQFDLIVHDNLIHGDACDGINFATVDPSHGPVEAFNNIIYEVGRGPHPPDGLANYSGVSVPGYLNNGPEGIGTVEVYNNTIYDCGSVGGPTAGAIARLAYSPGLLMRLRNNIIVQPTGTPYFTEETETALVEGENNLWFGDGDGPASLSGNVNSDPLFIDEGSSDFTPRPGSPAIDAGENLELSWDIRGRARPQGEAPDLGAIEAP